MSIEAYNKETQLYYTLKDRVERTLQKLQIAGVIKKYTRIKGDCPSINEHFNITLPDSRKRDILIEISNTALNGSKIRIPTDGFSSKVTEEARIAVGITSASQTFTFAQDKVRGQHTNTIVTNEVDQYKGADDYIAKIEALIRNPKGIVPA